MTLDVNDWFRSVTVLGIAFVAVIATTIGLATIIVPAPAVSSQPSGPASDAPTASGAASSGVAVPSGPGQIGGTVSASGAESTSFIVSRESTDGRYALVGDEGRIYFDEDPLSVAQVSFDGYEFFLDPDDCTISPGERDAETGVAIANIHCEDVEDVRGKGTMTLDGDIGIAADLLGLRGDLPATGGSLTIGGDQVVFEHAEMLHPRFTAFVGQFIDVAGAVSLTISYDGEAHGLVLSEILFDQSNTEVAPEACELATTEVGLLNPHTRLLELTIDCPSLELANGATIAISGSLMVEEVEPQF
jgi:hypothetical protein